MEHPSVKSSWLPPRPSVAADANGGIVVVWSGQGGRAQRFATDPICGNADGSGMTTATDALRVLQNALGLNSPLACPFCS